MKKNHVTERFIEVLPPDYQLVKHNCQLAFNEIKLLKNRCHVLEHILHYGEISPMSNIITNFKSMSDFYLQQLVKEVEIYRSSSAERTQLLDFLKYLRSVTREIEDILIVER